MDCKDAGRLLVTAAFQGQDRVELENHEGIWLVEPLSTPDHNGQQSAKLQREDWQLILLEETEYLYGFDPEENEYSIYVNDRCLGYIRRQPEDHTWEATPVGNPARVKTVEGFSHELYAAQYLKIIAN
jgi:hypothetical protein